MLIVVVFYKLMEIPALYAENNCRIYEKLLRIIELLFGGVTGWKRLPERWIM